MNIVPGKIESVRVHGSLSLVRIKVPGAVLSAVVIDTPGTAPYLAEGGAVKVIFKETEVVIGKGTDHIISLQNRLPGSIRSIEVGELLSKLTLDTEAGGITSIITANAVQQLQLKKGDKVTAMIKTNEIMLSK